MIILDTHIWLWWINGDTRNLDQSRIDQIVSADEVAVSAISCFEYLLFSRFSTGSCQLKNSGFFPYRII
ncbi:PIN domain-containing protein [Chlorobium ferrooxidans]|uniref:hypothetical protein n=1 Tax=Chlorobium ferrooxidans TaxID=84205 RepID=UPI0002FA07EB|nr:hypothetical protein [Chlorobium ferrooxidans]